MVMRFFTILLFFFSLNASAQTFTFECVSGARLSGDSCDICPNTIVNSRSFNGLVIYLDSAFYKWVDQPYSVRTKPGNIVEYWEHGANPYSERVTIPLELTDFFTVEGMADSTWCNFTAPNRYQELLLDSLSPTLAKAKIQAGNTGFGIKAGSGITFDFDSDTLIFNSSGGGGGTANNGVSDNEDGGKFRLGNRYMGTPDAPFTMDRSLNIDGRVFFIGDLSDSTLLTIEGATDKVGFGIATPQRKVDVNGEVRIRDLTTDTPTGIVGHDADGDLGTISTGTGISLSGGVLSSSIVQGYWKIRDGGTLLTSRESMQFNDAATIAFTLADDVVDGETDIEASIVANSVGNTHIRQGVARSVIGVTGNVTANVADIQGTADQVLRVNTAGTALAFGQVATGGITDLAVTTAKIADDAVTYAKIQNVVNDDRFLGRISGANGIVEELTAANARTIMEMTPTNNRFALWTSATALSSDALATFDAVNDRVTFTNAVATFGAGAAVLNVGTGAQTTTEFLRMSGTINGNALATLYNARNVAATDHAILSIISGGGAAGDAMTQYTVNGVITHVIGIDNTDDRLKITPNSATPGGNANMGVIVRSNAGTGNTGINKDFPTLPLDGLGLARFEIWENYGNEFTSANVSFGTGAGTGPSVGAIVGTGNDLRLTFNTGTAPTANGDILIISYPFLFTTTSIVTFSARDADAATDDDKFYISAEDNGGFTLKANGTLAASTSYIINFHFGGY